MAGAVGEGRVGRHQTARPSGAEQTGSSLALGWRSADGVDSRIGAVSQSMYQDQADLAGLPRGRAG